MSNARVYLQDADFTLWLGDAMSALEQMPDGSADCVVTSPPYWGLRDYGTGTWDGGNPECDHAKPTTSYNHGFNERWGQGAGKRKQERKSEGQYAQTCGKCGARRKDKQLGLEPTPDLYVRNMVAVFRQVRRVLADHGTCWVNLGDSYASGEVGRVDAPAKNALLAATQRPRSERRISQTTGLKPKDLVGIPWRTVFALQADGWYLRSDIVWAKPNPMPESVTDRPTKAHEYVFLLTKKPRYWFDAEAVREPHHPDGRAVTRHPGPGEFSIQERSNGDRWPGSGRNVRSVWDIATQPYPEAHFATYPEELVRRCLLAGCPEWVCRVCGKPRERIVDVVQSGKPDPNAQKAHGGIGNNLGGARHQAWRNANPAQTLGWSDCGHNNNWRPGIVLDPFLGSGTTALVARKHGRHTIGIELNEKYAEMCAQRLSQLSLLAEWTA